MSQSNEITATQVSATDVDPCTAAVATNSVTNKTVVAQASTRDGGRVHIGAGMMHFHTTKDAGRVHIGAGMLRF
jgi:hypothetical protein